MIDQTKIEPTQDREFLKQLHACLDVMEIIVDELVMGAEKEGDAVRIRLVINKLRNLEAMIQQQRTYLVGTLKEPPSHYKDGRRLNERQKMVFAAVKQLENQQPLTAYRVCTAVDLPMSSVYRTLKKLVNAGFLIVKDGRYWTNEAQPHD